MHNIPEGLAVALVLMPRGVSKFGTVLWSIFTSMPQPLIAVPVFMFASHFIFWQSVGLGFAAGSMIWVTSFELLADAVRPRSHLSDPCARARTDDAWLRLSGVRLCRSKTCPSHGRR
jgi:zinc transporter ZupT